MLTMGTRIKLVAFLVIGLLVIVYIGLRYANLGQLVGLRGYYVVKVQLADSGGIFSNAEVTYRGVTVGRVGALNLNPTGDGIEVDLHVDNAAPPISSTAHAVVADRSAVGEQYVDLRPSTDRGPYLHDGSVIARRNTQLPLPVQNVLGSIDSFASSVPTKSLRTVVDELYDATQGQGPNLQTLLDTSTSLTDAAGADLPNTTTLIDDSQTVLKTQADESSALNSFGQNAELLAQRLARSDPDLRRLITAAPLAAEQISGLLQDTTPELGVLLGNLLTTSDIALSRHNGLEELLVATPAAVAAGSTVINPDGATFGMALTFFDPLPCSAGYQGTVRRSGTDTTPQAPLNTQARCTLPAGSGVDVRGSAHAPQH